MNGVFQFFILLFPPFSVQHVPNFYHQKLHTVHTPPRPGQGMPYHGEATSRQWHWSSSAASAARLGVQLPMAGLEVERSVELLTCSAMLGLWNSHFVDDPPSWDWVDGVHGGTQK